MLFQNGSSVRGMKLIEFLEWARKSFDFPERSSPEYSMLALPPLQRNAAWNPAQVVGVWDSVLRGLPLGAFMLQRRPDDGEGRGAGVDARNMPLPKGWDLLDGQQRTRSILLGFHGPNLEEGKKDQRCFWIDLDAKPGQSLFKLHLTSSSQPFGYDANGYKLTPRERAAARVRYEPEGTEIRTDARRAYNHELFSGFIQANLRLRLNGGHDSSMPPEGYPKKWPPLPAQCQLEQIETCTIMPLHLLVQAWTDSGVEGLSKHIDQNHPRFEPLCEALGHLTKEIALIDASAVEGESLSLLYDRIGAGGTPLTMEERLFSFYKSKKPELHNIVCEIYEQNGRVMASSKIAASAIRIANAIAHQTRDQHPGQVHRPNEGNGLPGDVTQFANALEQNGASQDHVNLAAALDDLIGFSGGTQSDGPFAEVFGSLFGALKFNRDRNPLGLPSVLIGRLPPNLVQVLLFWRLHTKQDFVHNDNHLLRFVMFWLLCVANEDRAGNLCFRLIRETNNISLKTLFEKIRNDRSLSHDLIEPKKMQSILVGERQVKWRSLAERIRGKEWWESNLVYRWWQDRGDFISWLQRHYLADAFPDYDPTADREDDTPYDVDHMVPQNAWGAHWGAVRQRLTPDPQLRNEQLERHRWIRHELGNSIGNKWLVAYETNRAWGDADFETKLEEIENTEQDILRLLFDVFPEQARAIWISASREGSTPAAWDNQRLESFQHAVEHRAAWLYKRLYEDIGFSAWQDTAATP